MSDFPIIINNLQFSEQRKTLSGVVHARVFDRLVEQLALSVEADGNQNQVSYSLSGWRDVQGRDFIQLELSANLLMICQRCLAAMPFVIHLKFTYQVTQQSEQELMESEVMDDVVDWVEADTDMNVSNLIEDELLLALPIAPAHDAPCTALKFSSGEKANPFDTLKALKKS
jgi:uncharacterized protein